MNRLSDIREEKDLNQKAIAEILGIDRSSYSDYETEETLILIKPLCTLANYYKFSTDYILCLTDERKQHQLSQKPLKLRLKELRILNNLTQEKLANLIEVSQDAYSKYELEKRKIPIDKLIFIAKYYKVSLDYILGRTDDPKPYKKSKLIIYLIKILRNHSCFIKLRSQKRKEAYRHG